MNAFINRACARRGFSLVEVLVTIAIISLLIALFVPAAGKISEIASRVKQKAQFANIEIALEAYKNDYGDYPISYIGPPFPIYTGTQILGEAIVGLDGMGFHPDSIFSPDRLDGSGVDIYYPGIKDSLQENASVQSRTGPYLENEAANAVRLGDIYGTAVSVNNKETMVLADMFTKKMNTGIKTGMPILYYKADGLKTGHDPAMTGSNVYESGDNSILLGLGVPWGSGPHSLSSDVFYRKTQDPRFTATPRPYKSQSFILISAGKDGLYGTADDIYNFDRVEQ